jgi:hypothetical protein
MFLLLNNQKKEVCIKQASFFMHKKSLIIQGFYFTISQGIVIDQVSIILPGITAVFTQVFTLSQIIAQNFLFQLSMS